MTTGPEITPARPRILVICAAGLERFVPALGAMGAIRAHHEGSEIILLAARAASAFAATAPYFDDVWIDETDGRLSIQPLLALRRRLRAQTFDRVYDLDGTPASRRIFWLLYGRRGLSKPTLPWSGDIAGTALAYTDPRRAAMHTVDRWAAQLKVAGIGAVLRPDLSWVARQVTSFAVPFRMADPFVLLAPSPGPGESWPASRWGELAADLHAGRQVPVVIGANVPGEIVRTIGEFCPNAIDLSGRATVNEMVFLAWAANAAVGADNGVMHLTAAAGCRTLVLYDGASDPALVGQRGNRVSILRRPRLAEIPVGEVLIALAAGK